MKTSYCKRYTEIQRITPYRRLTDHRPCVVLSCLSWNMLLWKSSIKIQCLESYLTYLWIILIWIISCTLEQLEHDNYLLEKASPLEWCGGRRKVNQSVRWRLIPYIDVPVDGECLHYRRGAKRKMIQKSFKILGTPGERPTTRCREWEEYYVDMYTTLKGLVQCYIIDLRATPPHVSSTKDKNDQLLLLRLPWGGGELYIQEDEIYV